MAVSEDKMHVFNERLAAQRPGVGAPFWGEKGRPELDYSLLLDLLKIPVERGDSVRSGVFANALDLWIAYEFAHAGFDADAIWPRPQEPRAADPSLVRGIGGASGLTARQIEDELRAGGAQANANVMGSVYVKQVDVGMSDWLTGPELLISTKTMSGSFGKNLANRFEEAYGDVKNLRGRHPLAAHGFFFLAHESILREPSAFGKAVHMLRQLSRSSDVYDAVALLLVDWDAGAEVEGDTWTDFLDVRISQEAFAAVPSDLSCERFFETLVKIVLANSPIDCHQRARELMPSA